MFFLALQNTYQDLQIALFYNKELVEQKIISSHSVGKDLIVIIDMLLKNNNKKLSDLSFVAVNNGPAPLHTLRIIIATVNGIHFATKIPLISVDGLDALQFQVMNHKRSGPFLVLLQAFNKDLFLGFIMKVRWKKVIKIMKYFFLQ